MSRTRAFAAWTVAGLLAVWLGLASPALAACPSGGPTSCEGLGAAIWGSSDVSTVSDSYRFGLGTSSSSTGYTTGLEVLSYLQAKNWTFGGTVNVTGSLQTNGHTFSTTLPFAVTGSGAQTLNFGNTGVPWTYNFPQVSGNLAYQVGSLVSGHCLQASGTAGGMADAGSACGSGGGGTPANPTATAGPTAVNGSATTYMRSDAAPAVQKGSSSVFGLMECDNTTVTCPGGVLTSVGGSATSVVVGTTTVTSGASGQYLYNNSGVLGNKTLALADLPTQANQSVLGNGSGGSAVPAALVLGANLAAGSTSLNVTFPVETATTSGTQTFASTDMGKTLVLNGSGPLVIPASGFGTTIFAPGQTSCATNIASGAVTVTNSTTGPVPMLPSITSLPQNATICFQADSTAANILATLNPTSFAGGGSGCVPSGSNHNVLTDNGSGACTSVTAANITAGALSLGSSGTVGSVAMGNATSGVITLQPQTGALGTVTVSIPAATDTLVNLTGTQTLTNKTLTAPVMTAPVLGTPASGVATNITGLPAASVVAGALASGMTATTQSANDNSTKIATTAYVDGKTIPTTSCTTSCTISGTKSYVACTNACAVTLPAPVAGAQYCVYNDDNVSTVITIAGISSVQFEVTARTSYKSANTSIVSGGAVGDLLCLVGKDSTHYWALSYLGTWS